jgi:hypothetical protein
MEDEYNLSSKEDFDLAIDQLRKREKLNTEAKILTRKLDAILDNRELFWKSKETGAKFTEWVQAEESPVLHGAEGHPSILDTTVDWHIRGN